MNKSTLLEKFDDSFLDIAFALQCKSLVLFVGTGVSKNLSPSMNGWKDLLESLYLELKIKCPKINDRELWIEAQKLENLYIERKKDIRKTIAKIISEDEDAFVSEDSDFFMKREALTAFLKKYKNIDIVTTNYDTLLSEKIAKKFSNIVVAGQPIAPKDDKINIYHIHGCKEFPASMVVTEKDYLNFLKGEDYFSKKFFTMLQENTIVILGYSLQDFNLKRILHDAQNNKPKTVLNDIYFISMEENIPKKEKEYYLEMFNIKVIDGCTIELFLECLELKKQAAKEIKSIVETIRREDIIHWSINYNDKFFRKPNAVFFIVYAAYFHGISYDDKDFLVTLKKIFKSKKELTRENNAWGEYEHFAKWLVYISKKIKLDDDSLDSDFNKTFLDCICHSLSYMGKVKGESWDALAIWRKEYKFIPVKNKIVIEDYIKERDLEHLLEKLL